MKWGNQRKVEAMEVSIAITEPPTPAIVEFHYRAAEFWIREADQVGNPLDTTAACAALAQAHATLGILASRMVDDATRTP